MGAVALALLQSPRCWTGCGRTGLVNGSRQKVNALAGGRSSDERGQNSRRFSDAKSEPPWLPTGAQWLARAWATTRTRAGSLLEIRRLEPRDPRSPSRSDWEGERPAHVELP